LIDQAPVADASLREIFLGDWEGLTTAEIAARYPQEWAAWVHEPDWDVVPAGEGAAAFDTRVAAAIDTISARHSHGDVLLVTHGGVIQVALHRIVGRASRGLFPFKIQNASLTLIEKRRRTVIAGVNDIAHLEAALITDVGPG
jgi:probable phosphoglycerate mutase